MGPGLPSHCPCTVARVREAGLFPHVIRCTSSPSVATSSPPADGDRLPSPLEEGSVQPPLRLACSESLRAARHTRRGLKAGRIGNPDNPIRQGGGGDLERGDAYGDAQRSLGDPPSGVRNLECCPPSSRVATRSPPDGPTAIERQSGRQTPGGYPPSIGPLASGNAEHGTIGLAGHAVRQRQGTDL